MDQTLRSCLVTRSHDSFDELDAMELKTLRRPLQGEHFGIGLCADLSLFFVVSRASSLMNLLLFVSCCECTLWHLSSEGVPEEDHEARQTTTLG